MNLGRGGPQEIDTQNTHVAPAQKRKEKLIAIILCGGKGERLRPITNDIPKSMVPILGRPLLQYQIENLRCAGVREIILCTGYMNNTIVDFFGDGSAFGVEIEYSHEEEPLGRGGAFNKAFGLVSRKEPFVVGLNGDNLFLEPIVNLIAEFERQPKEVLALLMLTPLISPFGIVIPDMATKRIISFREKPTLPHWINAGAYVFRKNGIAELLPKAGDLEAFLFPQLAEMGQLGFHLSNKRWVGVDTYKDIAEAEKIARALTSETYVTDASESLPI